MKDENIKLLIKNEYENGVGVTELSKKYNDEQYEILTYQKIRRSWYECPKPRIRIKK